MTTSRSLLVWLVLVWTGLTAAKNHLLENQLHHHRHRRLPSGDLFVGYNNDHGKMASHSKKSYNDYNDAATDTETYYNYYPKKADKDSDYRIPRDKVSYKGSMSGKGGKGKGKGSDGYYYYYYDDDATTKAPKGATKAPSPAHHYYPPHDFYEPPRDKYGKGGGKGRSESKKKSSGKYDDGKYGKKQPTSAPKYSRPPVYIPPTVPTPTTPTVPVPPGSTGAPVMPPVFPPIPTQPTPTPPTAPTTPTPPTPTPPTGPTPTPPTTPTTPTPPSPTPPTVPTPTPPTFPTPTPPTSPTSTSAPTPTMGQAETPTSAPVGERVSIELSPFSVEYDIAPIQVPPSQDVAEVVALTETFLRNYMQQNGVPGFTLIQSGVDLVFPTYTIDYEASASVTEGSFTEADLNLLVSNAFRGASLQSYIDLMQGLPPSNAFSRTSGVRRIDPPNRNSGQGPSETGRSTTDGGRMPVTLLSAAGAVSFGLIVLGLSLNRREKKAMRQGNQDKLANDVRTLAGDTYAGDTFEGTTVCSGGAQSSGNNNSNSCNNNNNHYSPSSSVPDEYDAAIRHAFVSSCDDSYVTEDDEYEEEKTEIEEEDMKCLSTASFSQYGGVVPVEGMSPKMRNDAEYQMAVNDAFLRRAAAAIQEQGDEEHGSIHSDIRSRGNEAPSVTGSVSSGDTSIHILEANSTDSDDLKRAMQTQQALEAYYANVRVPSVEQPDYEDEQVQEVYADVPQRTASHSSLSSRRSEERSVSQRSQQQHNEQQQSSSSRSSRSISSQHQGGNYSSQGSYQQVGKVASEEEEFQDHQGERADSRRASRSVAHLIQKFN